MTESINQMHILHKKSPKLYDYFRSSASYRVRIALNLKGLGYEVISINLRENNQKEAGYKEINPQGLVPSLEIHDQILTQSLAILDFLEETYPEPPLLPSNPLLRVQIKSFSLVIACDIHPLNNLRVLNFLKNWGHKEEDIKTWYHHWLKQGFDTLESMLGHSTKNRYCFGDEISFADICLVPQVYNAERYEFDLSPYPLCVQKAKAANQLEAFQKAHPNQISAD